MLRVAGQAERVAEKGGRAAPLPLQVQEYAGRLQRQPTAANVQRVLHQPGPAGVRQCLKSNFFQMAVSKKVPLSITDIFVIDQKEKVFLINHQNCC